MLLTVVAAALSDRKGHILIQRRPVHTSMGGLWEFPGGKVEPGESPEAALVRELEEELGIITVAADLKPHSFASAKLGERDLLLLLFGCVDWVGTPKALHAVELGWVSIDQLNSFKMPPADEPLVKALMQIDVLKLFGRKAGEVNN